MSRQKNIKRKTIKEKIMSGGHWDYIQYRFTDVIDDIERLIEQNGKPKTEEEIKEERWYDNDWYEKYPEDLNHYEYPQEVIEQFKKAAEAIKIAQVYMQRMDWLLSCDDGEESFLRRIDEDLKQLQDEKCNNN
jgi:hypothetical protein